MTVPDLLGEVLDALDHAGIDHMIAGSVVSSLYGEPRTTQDIDVVIDPDRASLERLLTHLGKLDAYVGDGRSALAARSMFNVIDNRTGWKIDLIIRKDRAFSRAELRRRRPVALGTLTAYVASPEDVILSKLEWNVAAGSERQLRDVERVIAADPDGLDDDYLDRWADELGIRDLLDACRSRARGL